MYIYLVIFYSSEKILNFITSAVKCSFCRPPITSKLHVELKLIYWLWGVYYSFQKFSFMYVYIQQGSRMLLGVCYIQSNIIYILFFSFCRLPVANECPAGQTARVSSNPLSSTSTMAVSRVPSPPLPEVNTPVAENWCYTQVSFFESIDLISRKIAFIKYSVIKRGSLWIYACICSYFYVILKWQEVFKCNKLWLGK